MPPESASLPVAEIIIGLLSGLGFFLFGLDQMTQALKAVAGDKLRNMLAKLTVNRWAGAATGAGVTAAVNSSSITTVLLVGFISAGVMSLEQAIPVIMGANIGSTVTAQIIAFNVTQWGVATAAAGFFLVFLFRKKTLGVIGGLILGLGLIFFGMDQMSKSAAPMRDYPPFIELMESMQAPLLGILAGALFTALVQSSAATTGIVIVLAGQGVISLEAGIALCFGANIGTCVTALLAAIGKPREAVQAAVVHLMFNFAGVIVFGWFIPQLAALVQMISPDDTAREIANAHTIFNIANTLLFIGFVGPFAAIVRKIVPIREADQADIATPRHINPVYLATPNEALEQARLEVVDLAQYAIDQVQASGKAFLQNDAADLESIEKRSEQINQLHRGLVTYFSSLASCDLQPAQSSRLHQIASIANYWENIAELGGGSLRSLAKQRRDSHTVVSQARGEALGSMQAQTLELLHGIRESLINGNLALSQSAIDAQPEVRKKLKTAREQLQQSLRDREKERLGIYLLENDFVEIQKQLYSLTKRIARLQLD
ncbi:Na/Pi cotransporter family protein [Cerasicoccus fimbriatus]|uniref:Na/Pi cotransporter family protein n=1 Tax=Cerasicoccus fimbriatus TaxID=3014554 RepID=UPI0022B2F027|nr:Na/Pi cotransporter family protein [Cerasicoccus sp. TK19100]